MDARFRDIHDIQLYLVAADLNSGRPFLFGTNPDDSIIEGVLASAALPPWVQPIKTNGKILVDGGLVSDLPIEPALSQGATEIIALDLCDPTGVGHLGDGTKEFLSRAIQSVLLRQRSLELSLAAARGVPLLNILLCKDSDFPLWDFSHTEELIACGYEITRDVIQKEFKIENDYRSMTFNQLIKDGIEQLLDVM
jgi:NTE family protein